jgi:hypothetical protein
MKETADQLRLWTEVKWQYGLSDAQVQMARELGMKPRQLAKDGSTELKPGQAPLAQRIESQYLKRFKKPRPDSVAPLRQLVRDASARERAERREKKRKKREAELSHAEAARVSMLTIQRMYGGRGIEDG